MKPIQFMLILLAFCLCGASAGEGVKPTSPHVALCIYSPTCVVRDKPIDIVVEAINTGTAPMTVDDEVWLERVVPRGPNDEPSRVDKAIPPVDGIVRIIVKCHVPAGSQLMHILPRKKGPFEVHNVAVAPGHSALIKVPLPLQAFEVGECALEATSAEGAAKSESFKIDCVSLPGGGNKVYQQ